MYYPYDQDDLLAWLDHLDLTIMSALDIFTVEDVLYLAGEK